jgi:hypothetical protein
MRDVDHVPMVEVSDVRSAYDAMGLGGVIDYKVFERAWTGYHKIEGRRREVMTVIDFTKPSTVERLFVIDMARRRLLVSSHVSHGQNSGGNYATSFSNQSGSHKSSLGFYLTGGTYQGRNGYSMLLDGLEEGINDHARARAIVVHGADYADPSVAAVGGRLGRSFGCPALPRRVNARVIDMIKDGTVLFIYADDSNYLAQSLLATPTP